MKTAWMVSSWSRLVLGVLTAVGLALTPPGAEAWGRGAHRTVHARAIRGLPKGMRSYFERHQMEMATFSPGARLETEGAERRFAIDRLLRYPFVDLPEKEGAFKERFSSEGEAVGRLPWLVQGSFARLIEAFRSKDKGVILDEADLLASLVTDLHNPLALTEDYDGQETKQAGLWTRFAVRLPDALEGAVNLRGDVAHLLDDPDAYVFMMIRGSYIWLDNLLYEEEVAARNQSGYTSLYFEELENRVKDLLALLFGSAARHVGSYWYTAWVRAGRPDLEAAD